MKSIFTKPEACDSLKIHLAQLQQLPLPIVSNKNLNGLSSLMKVIEVYRRLPSGLNSTLRQQFKDQHQASKDNPGVLKQLLKAMRAYQARYGWNRYVYQFLNTEAFWQKEQAGEHGKDLSDEKRQWQECGPYAYYASDDLHIVGDRLLKIASYSEEAFKQITRYRRRYRRKINRQAGVAKSLQAFEHYVTELKKKVSVERQRIAQAMFVRLELASQHHDVSLDDVMYTITQKLSEQGCDLSRYPVNQEKCLGQRPYNTPQQRLGSAEFHYFHHYIMQYGNNALKKRCQELSWVKAGRYRYGQKKRVWYTASMVIAGIAVRVPRTKWRPQWLFRGRNARYDAFQDITSLLRVRETKQRALTLHDRFAQQTFAQQSAADHETLHRDFTMLQAEYQRIKALNTTHKLRLIHWSSRRALKAYRQQIVQRAVGVVKTQLNALVKALDEEPQTLVQEQALLDRLMNLMKQLRKASTFFAQVDPHTSESRQIQVHINDKVNALHQRIAAHKIQAFLSTVNDPAAFKQRYVVREKQGKPIYRLPDAAEVMHSVDSVKRYVLPKQATAIDCLAGVLRGIYRQKGKQLHYDDLYRAAQVLTDKPAEFLSTLFQQRIVAAVLAKDTPGYQLLQDYVRVHAENNQPPSAISVLLKAVEKAEAAEQISLFSALKNVFSKVPDLNAANSTVEVNAQQLKAVDFCQRVRLLLPPERLPSLANNYLMKYVGYNEHLWPLFSVLPQQFAIRYAQKRLAMLLTAQQFKELPRSQCCKALAPLLQTNREAQQAILKTVNTVALSDQSIAAIDEVVKRFADEQVQRLWNARRDAYVNERLSSVLLTGASATETVQLRHYIRVHRDWFTQATHQQLSTLLRYLPMDSCTAGQQAVVDAIDNIPLWQCYYSRLLERALADTHFAEQHLSYLLEQQDKVGQLLIVGAPNFRDICQRALQQLDQQDYIENINAVRILSTWLSQDKITTLLTPDQDRFNRQQEPQVERQQEEDKWQALIVQFNRVTTKLIQQIEQENWFSEVAALMNANEYGKALKKIEWLRDAHGYLSDDTEKQNDVARVLQAILNTIEVRYRSSQYPLTSQQAVELVKPMCGCLATTALVMWELTHYEKLCNLTKTFKAQWSAVLQKQATTLSSLSLFCEAMRKQVIALSDDDKATMKQRLEQLIKCGHYLSLSIDTRNVVENAYQLLGGDLDALQKTISIEQLSDFISIPSGPASNDNPANDHKVDEVKTSESVLSSEQQNDHSTNDREVDGFEDFEIMLPSEQQDTKVIINMNENDSQSSRSKKQLQFEPVSSASDEGSEDSSNSSFINNINHFFSASKSNRGDETANNSNHSKKDNDSFLKKWFK